MFGCLPSMPKSYRLQGLWCCLSFTCDHCCLLQQRARIHFSDSVEAASSGLHTFCMVCLCAASSCQSSIKQVDGERLL